MGHRRRPRLRPLTNFTTIAVNSADTQTAGVPLAGRRNTRLKQTFIGDTIYTAIPLTLRGILPTLPAPGVAGSVDICQVLTGRLRAQLLDPESLLPPEQERPRVPPKAITQMEDLRNTRRSPTRYGSATWQSGSQNPRSSHRKGNQSSPDCLV